MTSLSSTDSLEGTRKKLLEHKNVRLNKWEDLFLEYCSTLSQYAHVAYSNIYSDSKCSFLLAIKHPQAFRMVQTRNIPHGNVNQAKES